MLLYGSYTGGNSYFYYHYYLVLASNSPLGGHLLHLGDNTVSGGQALVFFRSFFVYLFACVIQSVCLFTINLKFLKTYYNYYNY